MCVLTVNNQIDRARHHKFCRMAILPPVLVYLCRLPFPAGSSRPHREHRCFLPLPQRLVAMRARPSPPSPLPAPQLVCRGRAASAAVSLSLADSLRAPPPPPLPPCLLAASSPGNKSKQQHSATPPRLAVSRARDALVFTAGAVAVVLALLDPASVLTPWNGRLLVASRVLSPREGTATRSPRWRTP